MFPMFAVYVHSSSVLYSSLVYILLSAAPKYGKKIILIKSHSFSAFLHFHDFYFYFIIFFKSEYSPFINFNTFHSLFVERVNKPKKTKLSVILNYKITKLKRKDLNKIFQHLFSQRNSFEQRK